MKKKKKKIRIDDPKIYKSTLHAKIASMVYGQFVANISRRKVQIKIKYQGKKSDPVQAGKIEFKPQKPKNKSL